MSKQLRDMTEPELKELFHQLAERVKWSLPKGTLFLVLAFEQELVGGGVTQYVSNCERSDMVLAMRETIARFESGDFIPRVDISPPLQHQDRVLEASARLSRVASAATDASEALRELNEASAEDLKRMGAGHPANRKAAVCLRRVQSHIREFGEFAARLQSGGEL